MFIIIYLKLRQRVHILNCISYNVCCRKRGDRVNVIYTKNGKNGFTQVSELPLASPFLVLILDQPC